MNILQHVAEDNGSTGLRHRISSDTFQATNMYNPKNPCSSLNKILSNTNAFIYSDCID